MEFCTMGMFIIDDIYPSPSGADPAPHLGIPGGAGTYCAVGARLLSPASLSTNVGWIVDCGTDFPDALLEEVQAWRTGVLLRKRNGLTTRGWNGYSGNEHRDFKYLTPKVRLTELDLTPDLLASKSFHMVSSGERCIELVHGITQRRQEQYKCLARPLFVWEPVPDMAKPEAMTVTLEAIRHIQVFSPNHAELAHIFGQKDKVERGGTLNRELVETLVQRVLNHASQHSHDLIVVIRAGADGCHVATNWSRPVSRWLPAVHDSNQNKVVDPTGGGNGFLGGFTVALVRAGDPVDAAVCGSITASFCIEQVGIPRLTRQGEKETWNDEVVQDRLGKFRERCMKS